jgi:hypothetical protein
MTDAYFAALVALDPAKASMSQTAKFTESAQAVTVGEGLWKTASDAPTNFKVIRARSDCGSAWGDRDHEGRG